MPYKPKKPCAYPGCRNLTDGRYCEAHAKAEAKRYNREERDPDSNRRYGRSWKQLLGGGFCFGTEKEQNEKCVIEPQKTS